MTPPRPVLNRIDPVVASGGIPSEFATTSHKQSFIKEEA